METSPAPQRQVRLTEFAPVPELDVAAYERLARSVRILFGIDLSRYRPAQVWRRVNGFAAARGLPNPDALVAKARHDDALRQAFVDMLTINVSEFFRNPEAWDSLAERFLGPMLRSHTTVRIWSAGCSLGYEPFSLAMLARELAPATTARILATDLDETILSRARAATYSEAQMAGVSKARRARFFRPREDKWVVRPELQALVTFRRHDLLPHRLPQRGHLLHRGGQAGDVSALQRGPSTRRRPLPGRHRVDPEHRSDRPDGSRIQLLPAALTLRCGSPAPDSGRSLPKTMQTPDA
jgi:chemotaxis protein methyltransferase CheR